MAKKHNIIEINGQRYDASSGVPLRHTKHAKAAGSEAMTIPVHVIKTASAEATHPQTTHPSRVSAKSAKGHAPQPAKTLMRQAVSKPKPGVPALRLKVAAQLDVPPKGEIVIIKPSVSRLDAARLHKAQNIKRSHLISRFNRRQILADPEFVTTTTSVTVSSSKFKPSPGLSASTVKGRPKTTADVLAMAIQNATSHLQPPVKPAKKHRVWRRHHAAAH